jgi:hypothetical protein
MYITTIDTRNYHNTVTNLRVLAICFSDRATTPETENSFVLSTGPNWLGST